MLLQIAPRQRVIAAGLFPFKYTIVAKCAHTVPAAARNVCKLKHLILGDEAAGDYSLTRKSAFCGQRSVRPN